MTARKLLLITLLLSICMPSLAQGSGGGPWIPPFMTVSSTAIEDLSGTTNLAAGQACFLATDNQGNPISFEGGSGGQIMRRAKCVTVTNGAFSVALPNTSVTNPVNPCLALTVTDTSNGQTVLDKGYECLQPSPSAYWCSPTAGTCDLDNFTPNNAPNVAVTAGPVGAPGPAVTLTIGSVTTGAPGTPAAATITGTPPAQTLSLTIPQGPPGSVSGFRLFTDSGALSSWQATANVPVSLNTAIRSISITTQAPWVGCSSPATVALIDNLGDNMGSVSLGATYSKGTIPINLFVANSSETWVAVVFTSANGCSQYATGVQISVDLDTVVITVTPVSPSVTRSTALLVSALVGYGSDNNTNAFRTTFNSPMSWSVDGVAGGNTTVGTIGGGAPYFLYNAPGSPGTHTITATTTSGAPATGSATITVN